MAGLTREQRAAKVAAAAERKQQQAVSGAAMTPDEVLMTNGEQTTEVHCNSIEIMQVLGWKLC